MAKGMTETGRFSSTFLGQIAPAGRKVLGSARPELIATSTKDKFTFNEKGARLLSIVPGSKVVMIDRNLFIEDAADKLPQNERFFVAKVDDSFEAAGVPTATVGETKSFSYSGIWSAILMNDPMTTEATVGDLVRIGMGILRGKAGKNFVGTKKAAMGLVRLMDGDNDMFVLQEGTNPVPVYRLVDLDIRKHEPKSAGKKAEEAETEE